MRPETARLLEATARTMELVCDQAAQLAALNSTRLDLAHENETLRRAIQPVLVALQASGRTPVLEDGSTVWSITLSREDQRAIESAYSLLARGGNP